MLPQVSFKILLKFYLVSEGSHYSLKHFIIIVTYTSCGGHHKMPPRSLCCGLVAIAAGHVVQLAQLSAPSGMAPAAEQPRVSSHPSPGCTQTMNDQ